MIAPQRPTIRVAPFEVAAYIVGATDTPTAGAELELPFGRIGDRAEVELVAPNQSTSWFLGLGEVYERPHVRVHFPFQDFFRLVPRTQFLKIPFILLTTPLGILCLESLMPARLPSGQNV